MKSDSGKGRRSFYLCITVVMSQANYHLCTSFLSSRDAKPYLRVVRILLFMVAVLDIPEALICGVAT